MNKHQYLKKAIVAKMHLKKAWVIKLLAITRSEPSEIHLDLANETWGHSYVEEDGTHVRIEDSVSNKPLFTINDKITIDNTWLPNISSDEVIETTIGRLLFNAVVLVEPFGSKIPYINERVNINTISNNIANKLTDTPLTKENEPDLEIERDPNVIYVDEYLKFIDVIQFLSGYSQLVSVAATKKNITKPTGIDEFKASLIKKYEGTLHIPTELAKFEQELKDFDESYLKDDPSNGKFVSGKVKNVARKKLFLSMGAEQGFKSSTTLEPILNSLDEGWSSDEDDIVNVNNSIRVGSYSRGTETIKGGVSAKVLLRATNNFKILDEDCGSKLGIKKLYTTYDIEKLVGRYILINKQPKLVESVEDAEKYINKELYLRTPMFCLTEGEKVCSICAGTNLSKFKNGLAIPITEITGNILAASLKKMHGTVLSTVELDLKEALS